MAPPKTELRKILILETATKVFAQKGFQEATITEIAKAAKVSEASIYEYFSTKEGLLFSIPGQSTREMFETMAFHLKLIRGAGNKLRAIVYLLLDSYQSSPEFAAVLMLFLKHNKKFLNTEGHQVLKDGIKQISRVIEAGIESKEFKSELDPYLARAMVLGTIEHLVTNWVMTGHPESLVQFVDPLIDILLAGIETRTKEA
ncbi:MAG: TetR/AcrR family transcriptional regulator [Desulfobacter sp.]|nr:TetR/AcrR family transcriptional regulator [Desulfobacter sp.]